MFRPCVGPKYLALYCRFVPEKSFLPMGRVCRGGQGSLSDHDICAPNSAGYGTETSRGQYSGDHKDVKSERMQGKLEKMRRRQQREDQLQSSDMPKAKVSQVK